MEKTDRNCLSIKALVVKAKLRDLDHQIKPLHLHMQMIENDIIRKDHELFFQILEELLQYDPDKRMRNFSKYFLHIACITKQ